MDKLNCFRIASKVAHDSSIEGSISVPDGQIISLLNKFLNEKYALDMAYRSFADRVTGLWRDSLVDHWYEHSSDERKMSYDIAMHIVAFGADPVILAITIPQCTSNIYGMCQSLANLELETIKTAREITKLANDFQALKVHTENHLVEDTKHLNDLRRMYVKTE